ncbi:bacillithiol biosynthesis cysteine-adding enzyme BshC [Candidatus Rubidus massiliensis]|nr:bacillithiol biosynthesis cysteine-adding enzyme BshC [Candidatus Rubidus massiliensis]
MKYFHVTDPIKDSSLDSFFEVPWLSLNASKIAHQNLAKNTPPRESLIPILTDYQNAIGNTDEAALKSLKKFAEKDSFCVFTGQQLGFMGGPFYTILKGLTCLKVAREQGAVPIFWLATEDHDINEINHTFLLDTLGNIKQYFAGYHSDGSFVEDLRLTFKERKVIEQFLKDCDHIDLYPLFEKDSYCEAMASLLAHLFKGTGLLFIEPKYLRKLAVPFFKKEIIEAKSLLATIQTTTSNLEEMGGKKIIDLKNPTNLFFKDAAGKRQKIVFHDQIFQIGKESFSKDQILQKISQEPERFSTNVAARTVLQSWLFPTLAYIAGPTEFAYYRQLKDYHRAHGVSMPMIIPRLSASFITPYTNSLLEKTGIKPWENIPIHWEEWNPILGFEVKEIKQDWLEVAKQKIGPIFPNQTLTRLVDYFSSKLLKRAVKYKLKKSKIPFNALHILRNTFYPQAKKQERVYNFLGYQKANTNIIQQINQLSITHDGHYYFYTR